MATRTYYEILGVSPHASEREIRRAYRRAMQDHHPDRHWDDPRAARRSRDLNAAKETLLNPERRNKYDEKLRRKGRYTDTTTESEVPNSSAAGTKDQNGATAESQGSELAPQHETPKSTSGFYSSKRTPQKRPRQRKNSQSKKTLGNVIGIFGGGTGAVFVAWLIIGSTWFQDLRESLSRPTSSVAKSIESNSEKREIETKNEPGSVEVNSTSTTELPPVEELQAQPHDQANNSANEYGSDSEDDTKRRDNERPDDDSLDETTSDANSNTETKPALEIVTARFGTGKKWVDVTKNIIAILERDPPVFVNSATGMKTSDPIAGYKKKTIIKFRIDGKQKQITLPAGPNRRYNLADQLK